MVCLTELCYLQKSPCITLGYKRELQRWRTARALKMFSNSCCIGKHEYELLEFLRIKYELPPAGLFPVVGFALMREGTDILDGDILGFNLSPK